MSQCLFLNYSSNIGESNHKITKSSENFRNNYHDSHPNSKYNIHFLAQNSKLADIHIPKKSEIKIWFWSSVTTRHRDSWTVKHLTTRALLPYGFLVVFYLVQTLTIPIHKLIVVLWISDRRAIIHNSNGWSNEKSWQDANVSFRLTGLMTNQRQEARNTDFTYHMAHMVRIAYFNLFIWRSGPAKNMRSTTGMAHCTSVIWRLSGLNLEW